MKPTTERLPETVAVAFLAFGLILTAVIVALVGTPFVVIGLLVLAALAVLLAVANWSLMLRDFLRRRPTQ